jgi:RNA polymerase subunit RPABC4/transcription elongation factor Spt4
MILLSFVADDLGAFAGFAGWISTVIWVALDAYHRRAKHVLWTLLTLFTGPFGALIYLLFRPVVPVICTQCGATLAGGVGPCPLCGHRSWTDHVKPVLDRVYTALKDSLVSGPIDKTKHTIQYMSMALLVAFVLANVLGSLNLLHSRSGLGQLMLLSGAGYWVLVAWWVYVDATWRRMDAVPWGVLTLVTNVIGVVTYLVIRYPDPRTCSQCGAGLSTGLKRCPYCGTETEPVCPQCQSPVRPDWVYCPVCAVKLPVPEAKPQPPAMVSISGNVVDARTGSPIAGAEITIDSKTAVATASTDDTGRFVLTNLSPRPYVLVASMDGYVPQAKPCAVQANGPLQVSFSLGPAAESVRM